MNMKSWICVNLTIGWCCGCGASLGVPGLLPGQIRVDRGIHWGGLPETWGHGHNQCLELRNYQLQTRAIWNHHKQNVGSVPNISFSRFFFEVRYSLRYVRNVNFCSFHIGFATTEFDRSLERILCLMHPQEIASVKVRIPSARYIFSLLNTSKFRLRKIHELVSE